MAEGSKAKPAKPKPKRAEKQSQQSERFIETARQLDADQDGGAFDRAISAILPRKGRP